MAGPGEGEPLLCPGAEGDPEVGAVVGAVVGDEVDVPLAGGGVDVVVVLEQAPTAPSISVHPITVAVLQLAIMAGPFLRGTSSRYGCFSQRADSG